VAFFECSQLSTPPSAPCGALSFEVELDRDARKRAARVRRPGAVSEAGRFSRQEPVRPLQRRRSSPSPNRSDSTSFGTLFMALLLVIGWGGYVYARDTAREDASIHAVPQQPMGSEPFSAVPGVQASAPALVCDGRQHCSPMTSCQAARQFLKNRTDMTLDGDGDGVPCERQLCAGILGNRRGRCAQLLRRVEVAGIAVSGRCFQKNGRLTPIAWS
jgi:hypothetical protein